jgi:hypothetical protein
MAVDETTILERITETLNACAPGTFSATVDSNYLDRNATAIAEAWREAAMMIGRAIISNPNHSHRNLFVSATPTALTHQGELPDMSAEMDIIEIEPYSGADYITGTPRTVQQIESFRTNPSNLYSDTAHNVEGSPLSGYYAIKNGRVYFTGYAARGYFPLLDRSTVSALIPDEYETAGVCLGVGLCVKEGDNLEPIASYYMSIGQRMLSEIASMGILSPMPSAEQAKRARGDA